MSKPDTKRQLTVTVRILPGNASEHQKRCWSAFWRRLIAEAKTEAAK